MQSRYYNPEWGRFINADGIIGQTGELLGHNLFVYTKNNPVSMSDKSGFRPIYTMGEETIEQEQASYERMAGASSDDIMKKYSKSTASNTVSTAISMGVSICASAADQVASFKVFKQLQKVKNFTGTCKELGPGFKIGGAVSRGWVGVSKFVGSTLGIFSIAATGWSLYNDYQKNNGWDIGKSMLVDGIGFAASVGVGILIGETALTLAPAIAVVGISSLAIGGLSYLAKKQLGVN